MSDVHIYKPPADCGLDMIFEDQDFLVISKPSGLLSVPGRADTHKDCLETRAQNDFPDARIVHRLDMDTSGIMVMARSAEAHRHMSIQFQKRKVEKLYTALLWGHLENDSGRVDMPIRCDWENRPRQIVDFDQGKPSQTEWRVIERTVFNGADTTRVALKPLTGRTHQLRVHMQEIGYPILGDDFYAHEDAFNAAHRLCLHAEQLAFFHPRTNDFMHFEAPCAF